MKFSLSALVLLGSSLLAAAAPAAAPAGSALDKRASLSTFAGTNAYWLTTLTSDTDVDTAMSAIAKAGLTHVRTWAFNDATSCSGVYFQCWSSGSPVINTGTDGLQRLDAVVTAAEKYGLKLIMPLTNQWTDYGGMDMYVSQLTGGSTHSDFYTNDKVMSAYKNYVKTVVTRYKSSSAVLAWELANEPRCTSCETSVITNWATTMSAYIKSLDSSKLVGMGDEGFMNNGSSASTYPYQGKEGVDFAANLKISSIDFGTLHLYPDSWDMTNDWGNTWISDHQAACEAAGKPCILEEYGVKSDVSTVFESWHNTIKSVGMVGDLYWQFGTTLSSGKTADDGYTIYSSDSDFSPLVETWAQSRKSS